jgi:two-component system chemotaxis sensor kinase CheA
MALSDDFLRELLATFTAEAQEHLQVINCDLLALEHEPEAPTAGEWLAEIFRAAHSLKGAARAVGQEQIGTLAHRLETLFGRIRSGELKPLPETFDLAYQALDAIGALVQGISTGSPAAADTGELIARLEAAGKISASITTALPRPGEAREVVTPAHPPAPARSPNGALRPIGPGAEPEQATNTSTMSPATTGPEASVAAPTAPPLPRPTTSVAEETVRMATTKLDALMAQVGELQVTRLGGEQRLTELGNLLDHLESWEIEWRKLRPRALTDLRAELADSGDGKCASAARVLTYLEASETRLHTAIAQLRGLRQRFEADNRRMAQVVADLEEDVRRTRMMPVSTVFETFPRMVRDLARELDKQVRLVIQGGEVEVDRSVLEQIKDPLTHLLRNSVDHGVEASQARLAAGKPAEGIITLAAAQRGDSITIEVRDDGAGINLAAVRAAAIAKGLVQRSEAEAMSDREALWLIFGSGLSTSQRVTTLSGRGVGLDVVRENIEKLHGIIDVDTQPGHGTRFTLNLPLTVATTLCLLVQVSGQVFALPISNVVRIVRVRPAEIGRAGGYEAIIVDGRPIPLARLAAVLGLNGVGQANDNHTRTDKQRSGADQKAPSVPEHLPVIILGSAERRVAFVIEALVGVQEVVVKSLPRPLLRVRYTAGATILGTGEVVIVLNVADLLRIAGRARPMAVTLTKESVSEMEDKRRATEPAVSPVIVVADDSFTTRTLEKNILEAAGYRVRVASDGLEAWNLVQSEGADLVVSDVAMPRLDGFALTAKIRADERCKNLPVILVTSLESAEDREASIQAGADAYIVKSAFDQESLLSTIRRLV